jgi:putative ABC transport system substrate-binding protein
LIRNDKNSMMIDEERVAREAATGRGKMMHVFGASTESDLDKAFADFSGRSGEGLVVSADPFFNSRRDHIIALAVRYAIPTVFAWPEFPRAVLRATAPISPINTACAELCRPHRQR